MENYDKILELLQKKELTEEEKILLGSLTNEKDINKFLSDYKNLEKVIHKNLHPTIEELGNYILIKNQLEPENKNVYKLIPKIEEHLRNCLPCLEEFKLLNTEFNDVNQAITKVNIEEKEHVSLIRRNYFKFGFIPVISALAIFVLLFISSSLFTPAKYKMASLENESEFYVTRGRMSDEFQQSIKLLDEKNYKDAIKFLEADIEKNHGDETIFYSYYILGLAQLRYAEKDFFGLFPSYDKEAAEEGLKNLKKSIEKNSSGRYNNINLDAYFYMGKANLMLERTDEAKECLNKVVTEKGSKMAEAEKLINELG